MHYRTTHQHHVFLLFWLFFFVRFFVLWHESCESKIYMFSCEHLHLERFLFFNSFCRCSTSASFLSCYSLLSVSVHRLTKWNSWMPCNFVIHSFYSWCEAILYTLCRLRITPGTTYDRHWYKQKHTCVLHMSRLKTANRQSFCNRWNKFFNLRVCVIGL